ncbi:FecR domain-containing protein [Rhizobiales bacterium]|uniref:FecR family protein n=1 Tax=Hongsoonwoonella zoysiae TaxID=2821844 RepID=UPI001560507B|nr:FecR family protein [Hongsoonwoonella zoysiae]NRG17504.1 FecR domain-containing protein [Hongsoonwoonella zoysiae]
MTWCCTAPGAVRLVAAFVFALSAVFGSPAANAADRVCSVERFVGRDVQVRSSGGWHTPAPDEVLTVSTRIRTGPASRLQVACDDGTTVTIGPSSLVDLGTLVGPREESILMRITNGIVGIVAPTRTWSSFGVRAPNLIASVRSTTWLVEAAPSRSSCFVREGRVAVTTNPGAGYSLGPGDGIDVGDAGQTPGVRQWGAARISETRARLGLNWR